MSKYGHFTQQYYGNKIQFPEKSFLIAGTSFYKDKLSNITYDTELIMKEEKDNKYDCHAICIMNNGNIIGYVPKINKELCKNNIDQILKIINIKTINGNIGIRVIPKCFYNYDPVLEKQILFCD
jgi:hypothetical protein